MDYSPWLKRENWPFLKTTEKEQNLQNWRGQANQNWCTCITHPLLLAWIFEPILIDFIFWHQKGNLAVFKGNRKGAKSSKPERPRQPKLVCMHYTSTPTCMNFWANSNWSNFLTPMDYNYIVHGPKGKFGQIWKLFYLWNQRGYMNQNWFACIYINLYLHEFFEPILFFDLHGL